MIIRAIDAAIVRSGLTGRRSSLIRPVTAATLLADGQIVGWFQGRDEFGPRALGSRSLLADPRRADIRARLNRRIKHRESFQPFGASVLAEDADGLVSSCPAIGRGPLPAGTS